MTSPARSYFGCQPGSAIVAGRTSTPATTVTLTDTTHPRLYQRVGTSKTITVSGTSNGTRIQARACPVGNGLTQDETLYPFVDIATNHAGGAFSLPLAVPQGDGWVVQVRDGVTHTLGSTGTHTFGVGVFIALIGQSNMENLFGAYAGAFTGAKGAYTHHGSFARLGNINDNFPPNTLIDMNNGHGSDYVASGYTSDPGSYIGTAITLLGNTLVASLGCPVVLLPYAASGSSINDWQPGQAYSNALLNDVDTIGGDFELALWLQGENDAACASGGSCRKTRRKTTMTILLTQATRIAGIPVAAGTQQTLEASLEADLVARKMATYISDPATALSDVPAMVRKTLTGGLEFMAGADAVISSGTDAPNDTDGKPDGSIYFQI